MQGEGTNCLLLSYCYCQRQNDVYVADWLWSDICDAAVRVDYRINGCISRGHTVLKLDVFDRWSRPEVSVRQYSGTACCNAGQRQ